MRGEAVLFSNKSDEWPTPQKVFDELNKEFSFSFDLACTDENKKCVKGFTREQNALIQDWHSIPGWLWLNPPYSECADFVKKAHEESVKGGQIVMLIPARTCTRWFHDYIYKKNNVEIRFIKGRLKFGQAKNSAPFPSMIVIFKGAVLK